MVSKLITTDKELDAAVARIDEIWGAADGTPEADELSLLAALVEIFEEEHYPLPPLDPVEAILFYMEQKCLRPADLVPFIGSRSRVSEVLNRRRPLSLTMIRRLHAGLGIPLEVLVQDLKTSAPAEPTSALSPP
jgi:HTH-type transcriptional regulator/antitoxin HigA